MKYLFAFGSRLLKVGVSLIGLPFFLATAIIIAFIARLRKTDTARPRLVWGSTPLPNNIYWSMAMRNLGYSSETYTGSFYSLINTRADWGRLTTEEFKWASKSVKPYLAFLRSLICYDVFFISFDGFFIGNTFAWRLQSALLKLAKKKVVVMPYGSDAYIYHCIKSTALIHGLMMSYPGASRDQQRIERNVKYWCRHADVVIPGMIGFDGLGRWDVLMPSQLHIDLGMWKQSWRRSEADARLATVYIGHAPNHRGFKGTEFLIDAVDRLKKEGYNVELVLLERMQNAEVKNVLESKIDILVEQLIFTGHGLNGLEGLASGLPVISNLEDSNYVLPLDRWSYFEECPIVSASPETLADVLKVLITQPGLRHRLGNAGRAYAEKYHGLDSAQYLFEKVIGYLYGRESSLTSLYHPLLSDYNKRKPKVEHPLIAHKIVSE